jgi:hypothetical protein
MQNLIYLLVALGLSVVLSMIVWLVQRKPKTFMSSIDDFRREMDALARDPADSDTRRRQRTARPANQPDAIMPAPQQGDLARKFRSARRRQSEPYDSER